MRNPRLYSLYVFGRNQIMKRNSSTSGLLHLLWCVLSLYKPDIVQDWLDIEWVDVCQRESNKFLVIKPGNSESENTSQRFSLCIVHVTVVVSFFFAKKLKECTVFKNFVNIYGVWICNKVSLLFFFNVHSGFILL